MGKNELSEAGTSMVRDNMANFRRDTRKTRVTGYPGEKARMKCSFMAFNNNSLKGITFTSDSEEEVQIHVQRFFHSL